MRARLIVAGVLAGAAALAAAVFAVLQFGRIDPSPPSLEDNPRPEIPGEILFQEEEGCLVRAAASGVSRSTVCSPGLVYYSPFFWAEPDAVYVLEGLNGIRVDLLTGEQDPLEAPGISKQQYPPRPPISVHGETAMAEEGDLVVIGTGAREVIASFDVGSRWIDPILWSPDGNWIVVGWYPPHDDGMELWIVSRDGKVRGTLSDDAWNSWVAWRIEGVGFTPELAEDRAVR
jgi:hypothetical protein